MLLTFEKIREIQLNERAAELQRLPEGFFDDVLEYLKVKVDTEEGKTSQKILANLFERRVKKVANLASICYGMDKIPDNMGDHEKELYTQLASAIKNKDVEFKRKLMNVRTYEKPPTCESNTQEIEVSVGSHEDQANVKESEPNLKIKFLKDTPELMTPDLETKSFKEGQEIELPKGFAEFLIKKGFAQ